MPNLPVWVGQVMDWMGAQAGSLTALVLFGGAVMLYVSTMAPGLVFGDPSEYTVVPATWGILHPPGYAFMTLLVKTWQTLIPPGSVAWRTNLLAVVVGSASVALIFGAVWRATAKDWGEARWWGAVLAGLALMAAPNVWQHSIHANAHIVTAGLAALSLFLLISWQQANDDRYLWAFCVTAGVSVTQHPLLVFGFPAYTAFILAVRPVILRQPRTLVTMVAFGVAGLFSWLYFPIRTTIGAPLFGPDNLNTWEGFSALVLARGLRVNLFAFGWDEQWQRLIVFGSLVQLQYALPVLALAVGGLGWAMRRQWRLALLLGLHVGVNLLFTLNTVQDVMAYLLVPLLSVAVLAGLGAAALGRWLVNWVGGELLPRDVLTAYGLLLVVFPGLQMIGQARAISLREYRAADDYVASVRAHFDGQGENAVLLSDWEHMTPIWYYQQVEGLVFDPADVTPVLAIGTSPTLWVDRIWENIEVGPIYLNEYRPDVINAGFQLQAEGPFYRVVPPPATVGREIATPLDEVAGPVQWLGYDLQVDGAVRPGARVPLVLYFSAPEGTSEIIHPYAVVGAWRMDWTTDSHWLSPWWQPGEVIAERWEILIPLDAEAGEYPVAVGLRNLSAGGADLRWTTGEALFEIGAITVAGEPLAPPRLLDGLAANFGNRVGVVGVNVRAPGGWRLTGLTAAPWESPLVVQAGQPIDVFIRWRGLASPEDSLTVFVHLNNGANQVLASRDYTPLGGAFPTQLWFPKWLPGQTVVDPYRIVVPGDLPPGEYYLEIGVYGLRSVQRVMNVGGDGSLAGDRFVLGWIQVVP